MARANFVKKANKPIYKNGKYVTYISPRGKREGQEKSKIDRTVPRDKDDEILIAAGESYWWWQFKNSPKSFSKTRPKNSQLTRSSYLSQLYDIQDRISEISCDDPMDLQSIVDDIKSDLESLKEECESSLENMPEGLRESSSGQMLQERIDSLDNAISEFDGLDLDYDEPDEDELRTEAIGELALDEDDEDDEEVLKDKESDINDEMGRLKEGKAQEWLDEKISEIQDISFD